MHEVYANLCWHTQDVFSNSQFISSLDDERVQETKPFNPHQTEGVSRCHNKNVIYNNCRLKISLKASKSSFATASFTATFFAQKMPIKTTPTKLSCHRHDIQHFNNKKHRKESSGSDFEGNFHARNSSKHKNFSPVE